MWKLAPPIALSPNLEKIWECWPALGDVRRKRHNSWVTFMPVRPRVPWEALSRLSALTKDNVHFRDNNIMGFRPWLIAINTNGSGARMFNTYNNVVVLILFNIFWTRRREVYRSCMVQFSICGKRISFPILISSLERLVVNIEI